MHASKHIRAGIIYTICLSSTSTISIAKSIYVCMYICMYVCAVYVCMYVNMSFLYVNKCSYVRMYLFMYHLPRVEQISEFVDGCEGNDSFQ